MFKKHIVSIQWLVDTNGEWGMKPIDRNGDGCGTQEINPNIASTQKIDDYGNNETNWNQYRNYMQSMWRPRRNN